MKPPSQYTHFLIATSEKSFLRGIFESPDDPARWSFYADYLQEQGDPRGDFIRVLAEHLQIPNWPRVNDIYLAYMGVFENSPLRYFIKSRFNWDANLVKSVHLRPTELFTPFPQWIGIHLPGDPEHRVVTFRTVNGILELSDALPLSSVVVIRIGGRNIRSWIGRSLMDTFPDPADVIRSMEIRLP